MSISSGMSTICAFCYKSTVNFACISGQDKSQENANISLVDRFIRIVYRLGTSKIAESIKAESLKDFNWTKCISCCTDCIVLIEKFCDDYHQLKCLELQLEWGLGRLVSIMKLAGRVPSRVSKLHETFEMQVRQIPDYTQDASNGSMADFKRFQHKLIKKCTVRLAKSQPRVIVNRLVNDEEDKKLFSEESHTTALSTSLLPVKVEKTLISSETAREALLGWLVSFFAVITLLMAGGTGHAFSEYLPNDKDEPDNMSREDGVEMKLESMDMNEPSPIVSNPENDFLYSHELANEFISQELNQAFQVTGFQTANDSPNFGLENRACITVSDNHNSEDSLSSDSPLKLETTFSYLMGSESPVNILYENIECSTLSQQCKPHENLNTINLNLEAEKDSQDALQVQLGQKEVRLLACKICKMEFLNDGELTLHTGKCHFQRSTTHQCQECSKEFTRNDKLKQHILLYHNRDPDTLLLKCCKCEKKFIDKSRLKFHIKTVHVKRTFKCAECDKVFKTQYDLSRHSTVHKYPLLCPICGVRFRLNYLLQNHLKTVHEVNHSANKDIITATESNNKSICSECGKIYLSKYSLTQHMVSIHTSPETWKFTCPYCEKKFPYKTRLTRHILHIHGKFQCSKCFLGFSQKEKLAEHVMISHSLTKTAAAKSLASQMDCSQVPCDYGKQKVKGNSGERMESNFSFSVSKVAPKDGSSLGGEDLEKSMVELEQEDIECTFESSAIFVHKIEHCTM